MLPPRSLRRISHTAPLPPSVTGYRAAMRGVHRRVVALGCFANSEDEW
jgi:hypothetical protein